MACGSVLQWEGEGVKGADGEWGGSGQLVSSVLTASCTHPGVCEALRVAEKEGNGMCWQGELSAVWRITLVAMALQGAGAGGVTAKEAMPWTWT